MYLPRSRGWFVCGELAGPPKRGRERREREIVSFSGVKRDKTGKSSEQAAGAIRVKGDCVFQDRGKIKTGAGSWVRRVVSGYPG